MDSRTIRDQKETQQLVEEALREFEDNDLEPFLQREETGQYLSNALTNLQWNIRYYDSSHPWILYWILNGLSLIGEQQADDPQIQMGVTEILKYCQHESGGFCGGHFQMPQTASTYAAILSLIIIGTQEAYDLIDRKKLYNFFMRMKNKDGSFCMADKGETDLRGSYIVVVISKLLNLQSKELMEGVLEYIGSCQTYEGGLGPVKEAEAHGGLTFCGLAALVEMEALNQINTQALLYWAINRQMEFEGGFQGRTNKLVDNCYSFWIGAIFTLLAKASKGKLQNDNKLLNNQLKLQLYALLNQGYNGGFIDKPGKPVDLYHTCYSMAGLSLQQKTPYYFSENYQQELKQVMDLQQQKQNIDNGGTDIDKKISEILQKIQEKTHKLYSDDTDNILSDIDTVYNIPVGKLAKAKQYFAQQPNIEQLLKP